ncbi:methyltransferase regulatory domain-containing protein [Orrella daihaiensis]|uniref:Methyltransferase regulatory domain-containing protein n=1 Tax=Orrella daihaiensis TaxID=2782176 RepID=A0ABY4AL78_9BURK|nr:methyltransferase regulatory domain-containing protein [Orrella daihaiensis]UOD50411.1 methyltransferase regulatory domain-containing protein [Orrella daihaiensis]
MTDWTAGYVADIGYTYGYYTELNPLRARLALIQSGIAPPAANGASCELGFGQGVSVNMHAAATASSWWATDFNPSQAGFAQSLAQHSGAAAQLSDEAFEEFCNRDDLPMFDFIGLHGIWSWISDDNRAVIVDFVQKRLKVGGVLYISYNTLPGWAAFAPMRHLMTHHASVVGSSGAGIVSRIDGAIDFAEKLLATNPLFARANPQVGERIKKLKEQNRHYLAHEYFNRDWHPMHFDTLMQWLEPAKVQFAGSANYLDYVDALNLSKEQQELLASISDPMFKESVRDFMINQQFRKDYWVKGKRSLSALERLEALRQEKVLLTTPRADIALKATGSLGEATLTESIYNPILDLLADHQVKSIGELEQALAKQNANVNLGQLLQAILVLAGLGHVYSAQDDATATKASKQTQALNKHLMQLARSSQDITVLASPVTGGGLPVSRFGQLFLLSLASGKKEPKQWAEDAWHWLEIQGQRLLKEGKTLETKEDNLKELTEQAQTFATKQLPILKSAKVI